MLKIPFLNGFPRRVLVHTDGALRLEQGLSGLAAVVHEDLSTGLGFRQGPLRALWARQAGRLTCNEAEYAAACLALEYLLAFKPAEILLLSDSQVLVHQMTGLATAFSPKLKQAQARLRTLVVQFQRVRFQHIPREQNRLADALANEAADGKEQSYERG
jgi:ribonuclease HI